MQLCNECGKSVKAGSGNFINRIPDFNSVKERKEMGKPYPKGEYMCAECDTKMFLCFTTRVYNIMEEKQRNQIITRPQTRERDRNR